MVTIPGEEVGGSAGGAGEEEPEGGVALLLADAGQFAGDVGDFPSQEIFQIVVDSAGDGAQDAFGGDVDQLRLKVDAAAIDPFDATRNGALGFLFASDAGEAGDGAALGRVGVEGLEANRSRAESAVRRRWERERASDSG